MQKRIPAMFAALLASCIVSTTGQTQSSDPWMGTWKVNLEKSTFSPGPKPTTPVTVKMESPAGGIKITTDGTTPDGKPLHTEVVGAFDGKDNPVKGNDLPMTAAYKRIDGRTFESHDQNRWQADDDQGMGLADGKTMTATVTGKNAEGQTVNNVIVHDKQ